MVSVVTSRVSLPTVIRSLVLTGRLFSSNLSGVPPVAFAAGLTPETSAGMAKCDLGDANPPCRSTAGGSRRAGWSWSPCRPNLLPVVGHFDPHGLAGRVRAERQGKLLAPHVLVDPDGLAGLHVEADRTAGVGRDLPGLLADRDLELGIGGQVVQLELERRPAGRLRRRLDPRNFRRHAEGDLGDAVLLAGPLLEGPGERVGVGRLADRHLLPVVVIATPTGLPAASVPNARENFLPLTSWSILTDSRDFMSRRTEPLASVVTSRVSLPTVIWSLVLAGSRSARP